jgi:hypothetical protein
MTSMHARDICFAVSLYLLEPNPAVKAELTGSDLRQQMARFAMLLLQVTGVSMSVLRPQSIRSTQMPTGHIKAVSLCPSLAGQTDRGFDKARSSSATALERLFASFIDDISFTDKLN